MRKRHWLILITAMLILSGCGSAPKEPEASPSPSVFYGEVPPGDPVGTEAMSTPPVSSTSEKKTETVQPQVAVDTEKENHVVAAEKPSLAKEPEGVLITESGTAVDVMPIEREGSGLGAVEQTESATGMTSGFDENELPLIKLS